MNIDDIFIFREISTLLFTLSRKVYLQLMSIRLGMDGEEEYLKFANIHMHFYCLLYLFAQWVIDHKGKIYL